MKRIAAGTFVILPIWLLGQTGLTPGTPRLGSGFGWPPNGDISALPRTESVFFNPRVPEYVVVTRGSDGQVQRLLHAPLHTGTLPHVVPSVTRDQSGLFHYFYSVSNGAGARASIQHWTVGVEEKAGLVEPKHAEWIAGPAPLLIGFARDRFRAYGWNGGEHLIAPGETVSGFEIVSELAPGYITAAFYGKSSVPELTQEDWASLPNDVAVQLRDRLNTGLDSVAVLIVGPRFARGATRDFVLDNFFNFISQSKANGVLPKDAVIAEELHSRLLAMLRGDEGAALRLDTLVRPGQVPSPKESEIISSLTMTMTWLQEK